MGIDTVSDLPPRVQYVAATAQTLFPYPFPIFANTDLKVHVDGALKVLTTDYTVSGATAPTGGNVTFLVAPGNGKIVTIYRDIAIQRLSDFQQNGPFASVTVNDELDRMTLVDQQLESSIQRALRIPVTANVADADIELPVANYANKFLTFDVTGKPTPAVLSSTTMTQAVIGNLLFPQTTAEISAGVTPTDFAHPPGDVRRYGMIGTGDETTKLVNAIAACVAGGYTLIFEPGKTYTVTGSSAINLNGVRAIDMRGATIDASAVTATIVFSVTGTKVAFKTGVTFAAGAGIIDVTGSGQTFARGDTILITSLEAHPNPARPEYFKGTRTYVDSQSGNDLRVFPQIDFAYTSSHVWKVTPNRVRWLGGTIIGNATVDQAGVVFELCDADVNGLEIRYCAQAGIRIQDSYAIGTGLKGRYNYLGSSGTSYCVAVSDLSEVNLVGCELIGARHAATIGGGTWLQTESGGVSGAAAYPGSLRITGGIYTSSRSGISFPSDPSLEIGAIDCHGIAKQLIVKGASIYGGLQLAAIESCIVQGNTIYHRNYRIVGVADSLSASWGHIQLLDNDCIYIGAFGPSETPAATPSFINAGSSELGKRLTVRGNRFRAEQCTINATASLGLIRGFDHIDFEDNTIEVAISATNIGVTLEIWGTKHTRINGNSLRNCFILTRPIGQVGVLEMNRNTTEGSGLDGLGWTANSIDTTAFFREIHARDNLARNCFQSGIRGRSKEVKRLYLLNNTAINCNVGNSVTASISAGIGVLKIADTDLLELIVAKGNVAVSDANAAFAHTRGFSCFVSATLGTNVILQDNISFGHTTEAMNPPTGWGAVTILREEGNSRQTLQTYTTGAHATLRDFTGTTTAAQALQLLESLVDDLKAQGKVA